jgi:GxxExxY protein
MNYKPLSEEIEIVAKKVIDAAYVIHKELGPGLLEKVYEICFCYELSKRGIKFKRQVNIPIVYDGKMLDESFRTNFNIYEANK